MAQDYDKELLEKIFGEIRTYEFQPQQKGIILHRYLEEEFAKLKQEYKIDRSWKNILYKYIKKEFTKWKGENAEDHNSKKFKYESILDSYYLNPVQGFLKGCLDILGFPKSLQVDIDLLFAVANSNPDYKILLNQNRRKFWYGWTVSKRILTFLEDQKARNKDKSIETSFVYRLSFWHLMEKLIEDGNFYLQEE